MPFAVATAIVYIPIGYFGLWGGGFIQRLIVVVVAYALITALGEKMIPAVTLWLFAKLFLKPVTAIALWEVKTERSRRPASNFLTNAARNLSSKDIRKHLINSGTPEWLIMNLTDSEVTECMELGIKMQNGQTTKEQEEDEMVDWMLMAYIRIGMHLSSTRDPDVALEYLLREADEAEQKLLRSFSPERMQQAKLKAVNGDNKTQDG